MCRKLRRVWYVDTYTFDEARESQRSDNGFQPDSGNSMGDWALTANSVPKSLGRLGCTGVKHADPWRNWAVVSA